MQTFSVRPQPPRWAIDAGLPEPYDDEEYPEYLVRLGLDPQELLGGLTRQTACLADIRLASTLSRSMRTAYRKHVDAVVSVYHDPQERRRIDLLASNLFPERTGV